MGLRDVLRNRHMGRQVRRVAAWGRLAAARFAYPRLVTLPPGSRVLVLSPHPDDDAIGPGGTLRKQQEAGASVTTLVLTDGGAGAPGQARAAVVATRRREEQAAAAHLGLDRVIFWDEPDGALAPSAANADRLRGILREVRPDLVYLPSFLDAHPDHRAVTPLVARALHGMDGTFTCGIYEFATPIVPNVVVDVSLQIEAKLRAVREHRSQLAYLPYPELVEALARWRGGAFARFVTYAEALYVAPVAEYLALWRRVDRE